MQAKARQADRRFLTVSREAVEEAQLLRAGGTSTTTGTLTHVDRRASTDTCPAVHVDQRGHRTCAELGFGHEPSWASGMSYIQNGRQASRAESSTGRLWKRSMGVGRPLAVVAGVLRGVEVPL